MTAKTRYFVVASILVLVVGLGTGLVAYYAGFSPAGAFSSQSGPEELRLLPSTAAVVAEADVREVMTSELRRRIQQAVAERVQEDGRREFEEATGINIETDIDRVVACLDPEGDTGPGRPDSGLVLARGRFNEAKIEALMRDHGASVEDYKGKRLIVSAATPAGQTFALAFVEPGLVALGGARLVRQALDLHAGGGASVATNEQLMAQIRLLDDGNAWAVGRFDILRSKAGLSQDIADRLPPITWFSLSTQIDSGVRGVLRAEARDDASAANLRDVIRGFTALAKLQMGSKPEYQMLVDSIQLGGTGTTVSLSFDVPEQVFDALNTTLPQHPANR